MPYLSAIRFAVASTCTVHGAMLSVLLPRRPVLSTIFRFDRCFNPKGQREEVSAIFDSVQPTAQELHLGLLGALDVLQLTVDVQLDLLDVRHAGNLRTNEPSSVSSGSG